MSFEVSQHPPYGVTGNIGPMIPLILAATVAGFSSLLAPAGAGLGLGIALAGAPGPVQAIILTETVRGGMSRGVRVQAGANLTFAVLLWALALGLSVAAPGGTLLRALKVAGGLFLILIALDAVRAQHARAPQ